MSSKYDPRDGAFETDRSSRGKSLGSTTALSSW